MGEFAFSIKSAGSDREFTFLSIEGEYFEVELKGHAVSARRRVWAYTDGARLVRMFEAMAAATSGWTQKMEWSSVEGELSFECTCDKLGHVYIDLQIHDYANGGERWSASARIETELGQLSGIASGARRFFSTE